MTLIYIFLFVILVFVIMSYLSLRKIKNQTNISNISDDRYYELKYKLQFISSVGVIIIAVAGFFGLDKYENFIDEFKSKTDSLDIKLNEYDKKISLLDSNITKYDSKISAYDNFLYKMDLSKVKFTKTMLASSQGLAQLKDTIDIIKKRNVLDKSFYVIDNLKIKNALIPNNGNGYVRYYFKDLSTIIGDKIPEFDKPPVVFVIPQSGVMLNISSLTNEYFEVGMSGYNSAEGEEPKSFAFGVLIARKLK